MQQSGLADSGMVVQRGGQAPMHAAVPMGRAGVQTAQMYNPDAGDQQAESQMAMQSQLSPQEYAVLQNLLAEADRWHGTNEGGQRVFTGRRGMSPDELNRLRAQGGRVRTVSPEAAARDDAREDARRQKAARIEAERAAREQREAEAAPSRNRRVLMKGQV